MWDFFAQHHMQLNNVNVQEGWSVSSFLSSPARPPSYSEHMEFTDGEYKKEEARIWDEAHGTNIALGEA